MNTVLPGIISCTFHISALIFNMIMICCKTSSNAEAYKDIIIEAVASIEIEGHA